MAIEHVRLLLNIPSKVVMAAVVFCSFGTFPIGRADAGIISSGAYTVGIGADGELYDATSGIGFRRNLDGYDPIASGAPRDSWGVSINGSGYYVDPTIFGISPGLTSVSTFQANSATITTSISAQLTVFQTFSFAASNVLRVDMAVYNKSGTAASITVQRDVNWNIAPSPSTETSVGEPIPTGTPVLDASYAGTENPDPTVPYSSTCATGCVTTGDVGGGIKGSLGTLPIGGALAVTYYYAINDIGQTPLGLDAQVDALVGGGGYYDILTYGNDGTVDTASHSAAIGAPLTWGIPEPATLPLLGIGLGGLVLIAVIRMHASALRDRR